MSSTSASAERLIMALVTAPDCPSAAPRASPGKMYLRWEEDNVRGHKLPDFHTTIPILKQPATHKRNKDRERRDRETK